MINIPNIPKEGVKNHFFFLTLLAAVFVIMALIYRPIYLAAGFILFVTFIVMFLINSFFTKAIYKSIREANRKLEFSLIILVAIVGISMVGFFGWQAQEKNGESFESSSNNIPSLEYFLSYCEKEHETLEKLLMDFAEILPQPLSREDKQKLWSFGQKLGLLNEEGVPYLKIELTEKCVREKRQEWVK